MLPDLTSLIDKTPTQIFIIIGLVIGLTFIAYAYYMIFSIVFLFFFHYETKRAFFGENPRSSTIVSLFFMICVVEHIIVSSVLAYCSHYYNFLAFLCWNYTIYI